MLEKGFSFHYFEENDQYRIERSPVITGDLKNFSSKLFFQKIKNIYYSILCLFVLCCVVSCHMVLCRVVSCCVVSYRLDSLEGTLFTHFRCPLPMYENLPSSWDGVIGVVVDTVISLMSSANTGKWVAERRLRPYDSRPPEHCIWKRD